jgi:hypothetical protein
MRRLYFLAPSLESAEAIVAELEQERIPERHIHVVGGFATPLKDLPEASLLQKTEFTHGIEIGLGMGGVAGLLGGLLAVTFPPAGLVLGGGAVLASTLGGASFGALVSGLLASSVPSHELDAFEDAIARGELLLIVDVSRNRVNEMIELIQKHHPEAEIGVLKPKGVGGNAEKRKS